MAKNNASVNSDSIYITKGTIRKDAIRVDSAEDIPEELRSTIKIVNGELELVCIEGNERCPLGSVIGYEVSNKTATGYNAWNIAAWKDLLDEPEPGVFYTRPVVLEAEPITEEYPTLLQGADISKEGKVWTLQTPWGPQNGEVGQAYWVRTGTAEDGTPKGYILAKDTESYQLFYVCDQNGNIGRKLSELDPA